MKMKRKSVNIIFIVALLAIVGIVISFIANENESVPDFIAENKEPAFVKQGTLAFVNSAEGDTLAVIDIEIADNDQKTAQGLMYRSSMPQNAGMLFLMRSEEMQGFWMKNTYIPLDIIFVDSQLQIVTIHSNTTPMKEKSYLSTKPALYVVEVNAGFCRNNNIYEGDKIDFFASK